MANNSIITKVTGTDTSSNRIGSTFYGTCSDAATTAAKTVILADSCVFDDSCLVTGVTIHVKFTNSNAHATPTLKIGSATPKQIMAYGTTKVGTTPVRSWYKGAVVSFTYDGTYWVMNDHSAIDAIISVIYPVGSIYMSVNIVDPGTYLLGTTWTPWGAGRVPVGVDILQTEFNTVEETGGEKTHLLLGNESGIKTHYHEIPSLSGTATATTNLTGDAYFHAGEVASILYNCSGVFSGSYGGSTTQYRTCSDLTARSGAASKGIIHFAGNHSHTVTTDSNLTSKVYDTKADDAHNNLQPYITCYMWKRTA